LPIVRRGTVLAGVDLASNAAVQSSDALISALAIEAGATVVTYDGDFARFSDVRWCTPGKSAQRASRGLRRAEGADVHPHSGRGGAIVTGPRPSTSPLFTAYPLAGTMAASPY